MNFSISWLSQYYTKIITLYKKKKLHPIILLQSTYDIGIQKLVYEISTFFLCLKKKKCIIVTNALLVI
ncbi:hypothetical protein [Buchnera aphidicola]|uniref:hypothetical protein n=1 Tax=Buchnera aphidicola TaxID=9 RepID=UPI00313F3135